MYGLIKRKFTSKLLFFVAYLSELAADPNKQICSINPWYIEFLGLPNKDLALFFSQHWIYWFLHF